VILTFKITMIYSNSAQVGSSEETKNRRKMTCARAYDGWLMRRRQQELESIKAYNTKGTAEPVDEPEIGDWLNTLDGNQNTTGSIRLTDSA
jgi:hypothetical protein